MTASTLVQLILSLCTASASGDKEVQIACFEQYTNCAVATNGVIITREQFNLKCLKEKAKGK